MARLGEGDARWLVADRGKEGTNVNNWHWAERDVLPWARSRLAELLGNLPLSDASSPGLQASTAAEVTVTGEAIVNNRKNKLIPAYELEVKGAWSGKLTDAGGTAVEVGGQWRLPYLAEENADEDPELLVSTSQEGEAARRAKELVLGAGKQAVLAKVRQFVSEIQAGGPVARDGSAAPTQQPAGSKQAPAAEASKPAAAKPKPKPAAPAGGKRTFETTERFYARPRDLFECFTDARRAQAFTQSPAKIEPRPGGAFELLGGSVVGCFTALEPHSRLALDWRFRSWQEDSKVEIRLEEPEEGTTVLRLVHSGIPEADQFGNEDVFETTAAGWKQQIFHRIRAVFGYGLGL